MRSTSMPGAWLHPLKGWQQHAIPSSVPPYHSRDSLEKEGEQMSIAVETDGRTEPREEMS